MDRQELLGLMNEQAVRILDAADKHPGMDFQNLLNSSPPEVQHAVRARMFDYEIELFRGGKQSLLLFNRGNGRGSFSRPDLVCVVRDLDRGTQTISYGSSLRWPAE